MTVFNFPTVGERLEFNEFQKVPDVETEAPLAPERQGNLKKLSLKDQLFAHTSQAIRFLQTNDLVPALPPKVDVVFTSVSLAEALANRFKGLLGKQPAPQYQHLACCDPSISTIYVSSAYLTSSKNYGEFSEALKVLDLEFGGDIRKVVERDLFHEIGHLALRERFKHLKSAAPTNVLYARMKANIEEGFADAFSFHLMCLRHPDKQQFAASENYFKECAAALKSHEVSAADVHRIFGMIPLMANGSVITDISSVVDRCWNAALQNNRDLLVEKMTDPYFKQDVMKAVNAATGIPSSIVAQFHRQVLIEGFDTKEILSVRTVCLAGQRERALKLK